MKGSTRVTWSLQRCLRMCALATMILGVLTVGCQSGMQSVKPIERDTPHSSPAETAGNATTAEHTETTGVTDTEILVESGQPISGPLKERSAWILAGYNTWLSSINDSGGIFGRKIQFKACDDAYDPERAIGCFNQMLDNKIFAACLMTGSATAAKYVPMAELHQVPLVGFTTGVDLIYRPFHRFVFGSRASFSDEVKANIDFLWDKMEKRRFAVIYQNDAMGASLLQDVETALRSHAVEPVDIAAFTRLSVSVQEPMAKLQKANPDVLVIAATGEALKAILTVRKQLNWHVRCSTISVATDYLIEMGDLSRGTVVSQILPRPSRTDLPTIAMYAKLMKKYAPNMPANAGGLDGMVNAMILCEGLKRAGRELTRTSFLKGMESIHDWDIGLGPDCKVNYSATDHVGLHGVHCAVVENGEIIVPRDWAPYK